MRRPKTLGVPSRRSRSANTPSVGEEEDESSSIYDIPLQRLSNRPHSPFLDVMHLSISDSESHPYEHQASVSTSRSVDAASVSPASAVRSMRARQTRNRLMLQGAAGRYRRAGGGGQGLASDEEEEEEAASERRGLLAQSLQLDDAGPERGRDGLSGSGEYADESTSGIRASLEATRKKANKIKDDHAGFWARLSGRSKAADEGRTFVFGGDKHVKHPPNVVRNQKYNLITFLPLVLYEQFKFFFNLYFLLVALSQFVPALKIGFIATYIGPLAFVLLITIGKEGFDDYARFKRDVESNGTPIDVLYAPDSPVALAHLRSKKQRKRDLETNGEGFIIVPTPSSKLKVGDLVLLHKSQRVPADLVLLRTTAGDHLPPRLDSTRGAPQEAQHFVLDDSDDEEAAGGGVAKQQAPQEESSSREQEGASGTCFVRTDQLDGETDWKLRVAVDLTQRMDEAELVALGDAAVVYAGKPIKDIHTFVGTFTLLTSVEQSNKNRSTSALLENHHQPADDRPGQPQIAPLNAENVLWANTVLAAGTAIGVVAYTGRETRAVMNTSHPGTKVGLLDLEINRMAKILCGVTFALSVGLVALNGFRGQWYVYIFRFLILFSSIIPISLRVNLDMGKTVYARQIQGDAQIPQTIVRTSTLPEELGRIEYLLSDKTGTLTQNEMELRKLHMGTMSYGWDSMDEVNPMAGAGAILAGRGRRDMSSRVKDVVLALALCHNVTPVVNDDGTVTYQASSPDEVAIVKWTESVGLSLIARDRRSMSLRAGDVLLAFDILEVFPFTSESKRMGIVIRDRTTEELTFYQKGADVVMAKIVAQNDWLDEECGNMAREGLRTLVVGRKRMTEQHWIAFERAYKEARTRVDDRNEAMARAVSEYLERDLELLGLTGVEDKLQEDVKPTLELLRNAGIKVWMLTGDKIETATCIAISSKLVARNQYVHQVAKLRTSEAARDVFDVLRTKPDCCLVIDGESLQHCLDNHRIEFITLATQLSAVVACRCSPTQKADVARLIREFTKKRVCCIGDGGNDVSMIQAADVGLGIVGKEGRQASLAADFSILQFSYLAKLLTFHGRNAYQRSAKLAQVVIHRGLVISVVQAVFSSIFYFAPVALIQGWLLVGYATLYTMLPVFSLVLDKDIDDDLALAYPELYKDLTKGRRLTAKTFASWLLISVYQGGAIMLLSLLLFENEFLNIVSITFSALVINELIMVALEITRWNVYMLVAELLSLTLYCISIAFLPEYFDLSFVLSAPFFWKTAVIIAVSALPLFLIKVVRNQLAPPAYSKLNMT
ncbi:aminophospholipid-transporting p-type atpase [Ceraceosorus bombacis]|uniref:Phospholipid-transporting ATPase n=1 Tax=Ceraceosorus bombacis TaxID=401625 RepID=A0A0P1BME0_9BASI|nr:aminophospholipid-transporting p-type atpase [Ceraceosorus bombacis]